MMLMPDPLLSDDDVICLDGSDLSRCPTSKQTDALQEASGGNSNISRLLMQVVRLHLSENCISPGCSAVREEAQKLGKKVEELEALSAKLHGHFTVNQKEVDKHVLENCELRRKVSRLEAIVIKQNSIIRDLEAQLTALQHFSNNLPLVHRSTNIARPEKATVKRSRSITGSQAIKGFDSPLQKAARIFVGENGQNAGEGPNSVPATSCRMSPSSQILNNHSSSKSSRIRLDVPYVSGRSLINFIAPISTPTLDYPVECRNSKFCGPIDLTIEINTEPSNFVLTRKVNGVVKYGAVSGCRPKSVKVFCYLESARNVLQWTSSMAYTFVDSTKMKFDIVFCKDQEFSAYDRIVVFASARVGSCKYVTNRVMLNLGQQIHCEGSGANRTTELEEHNPSAPVRLNGHLMNTDDSNFEVYRP